MDNETETDSVVSSQRERPRRKDGPEHGECWQRRKSSAGAWCGASAADTGQLCLLCRSFPAQKGLKLEAGCDPCAASELGDETLGGKGDISCRSLRGKTETAYPYSLVDKWSVL